VTETPVCIFAKPPVPGKVKTRLAQDIGDHSAASLAAAMLRDIWSIVARTPGITAVLAAAEPGTFPVNAGKENIWLQGTGELGTRIENVLRRGLRDASAVIALGADSPLLTTFHLEEALHQLKSADAVIGPSCDGGFYLLGLRHCPAGLLADLPWSSAETKVRTENRLYSHGMAVREIPMLPDVDTIADLLVLYNELKGKPRETAPATRHWFVENVSRLRELEWSAS
jgi:rSAM/selenodomain-associated transferase 1